MKETIKLHDKSLLMNPSELIGVTMTLSNLFMQRFLLSEVSKEQFKFLQSSKVIPPYRIWSPFDIF